MVDVGEALEPAHAARRARMARHRAIANGDATTSMRSPRRRRREHPGRSARTDPMFRSGFPPSAGDWSGLAGEVPVRPSFAKGGLSNGWGASVLPYRDEDLGEWPIRAADLAPHYGAGGLDHAGSRRAATTSPRSFRRHRLDRRAAAADEHAGAAAPRSVRPPDAPSSPASAHMRASRGKRSRTGCRRCAMCLHGCPYGSDLQRQPMLSIGCALRQAFPIDRTPSRFASRRARRRRATVDARGGRRR